MKQRFSDRVGATAVPTTLQLDGMSDGLRNRLWNSLRNYALFYRKESRNIPLRFFEPIADRFLKVPHDDMPRASYTQVNLLHEYFFKQWQWYEVYNFVEFLVENYEIVKGNRPDNFCAELNSILEDELSGYRVVGTIIVPITSETELNSIEDSLSLGIGQIESTGIHLRTALKLFSKRPEPDYRNCIKEAISAVESLVTSVAGEKDFGRALNGLRDKLDLHPAFVGALGKLYGYTSDEDGVRHGIFGERDVGFDEAKFMLVTCSAMINFLARKSK